MSVIISAIAAPDLSANFLDKEHVYTAGKAVLWAAALGPARAARAALVARPLTPPGGVRSATCRIPEPTCRGGLWLRLLTILTIILRTYQQIPIKNNIMSEMVCDD
jgi:hypothetical protein